MINRRKIFIGLAALLVLTFLLFNLSSNFGETLDMETDRNQNGVWDEVEEKIHLNFGQSKNLELALKQTAIALQKAASEDNMNKSRALEIDAEVGRAQECVNEIDPKVDIMLLEQWIVNSKYRTQNYTRYNVLLSGEVSAPSATKNCDFPVAR